jgi:hypothetical protein
MQPLVHIGLSALFAIAPALCCCNVRLITGQVVPLSQPSADCRVGRTDEPALPRCCQPARSSCCHSVAAEPPNNEHGQPSEPSPAQPLPRCDLCFLKPDATPPKSGPSVDQPEPTGVLLPLALVGLTALPPEHLGLVGGLALLDRTGVDTRSECLLARHVMRC